MNAKYFFTFRKAHVAAMLFSAVLITVFTACLPRFPEEVAEDNGFDVVRLELLSATLDEYVAEGRLSGGVALVMRNGETIFYEAFGLRDREAADTMQVDALFALLRRPRPS